MSIARYYSCFCSVVFALKRSISGFLLWIKWRLLKFSNLINCLNYFDNTCFQKIVMMFFLSFTCFDIFVSSFYFHFWQVFILPLKMNQ